MSHLTKPQLRATILLSVAVLLILTINSLYTQYRLSEGFTSDSYQRDSRILDSLLALIPPEKSRFRSQFPEGSDSYQASFSERKPEAKLSIHTFDPNSVRKEEWLAMGLPERVFNGLEKYRNKGGTIRKPKQVLKLYNLDPDIGKQMLPFVQIDSSRFVSRFPSGRKEFKAYERKQPEPPFDLNLADTTQLMKVFGIGGKTAHRIIRYRTGIGGFLRKEQVYEIFGLDSSVVDDLFKKAYLPANPQIQKLRINQITEEELAANPYVRKGMARIILKYRNQHGPYKSEADLLKIKILSPEVVSKIKPYLEF
jgi:competence protein ComEA